MVCGVGLGVPMAVDGGLLFLVYHMLYKALLFMCAGALIYTVGTEKFHELHCPEVSPEKEKGLSPIWKALPVAFVGALVGALAICGAPPFNGYVGKHLIKHAAHGVNPAEMFLILASVGTALCFCKFIYFGFIKARGKVQRKMTFSMQAGIVVLSVSCIATGVWPQLLAPLLPYNTSLDVYTADGIITALKLVAYGIVAFILLARVLEKEIKLSKPIGLKLVIDSSLYSAYGDMLNAAGALKNNIYSSFFHIMQRLDYKPSKNRILQFFNVANLDFDVFMLMGMLGVALVFLFYLQFGILGIGV